MRLCKGCTANDDDEPLCVQRLDLPQKAASRLWHTKVCCSNTSSAFGCEVPVTQMLLSVQLVVSNVDCC